VSEALFRPSEISEGARNAEQSERVLGWKAQLAMSKVVANIVGVEIDGGW